MTKSNGPPALQLPPITNPRLAKAYAHPTRVHILSILAVSTATPTMLAELIGETVNNVAYHVKVLRRLECVELVEVESVGGGRVNRHHYRATRQPLMHLDTWEMLSDEEKYSWAEVTMRLITADIAKSMQGGLFLDPDDGHLSRTPMTVDREGWVETTEVLDRAAEEIFEIQSRAAARLEESDEERIHEKVAIIQFRTPTAI